MSSRNPIRIARISTFESSATYCFRIEQFFLDHAQHNLTLIRAVGHVNAFKDDAFMAEFVCVPVWFTRVPVGIQHHDFAYLTL